MKLLWLVLLAVLVVAGCTSEGGNCCPACSDPNAILIKEPGGECKCMSDCPGDLNFLQEAMGGNCCTGQDCAGPAPEQTTTTTLPCQMQVQYPYGCIGSCGEGNTCDDERGQCVCKPACDTLNDYKMCYAGGCEDPREECIGTIQGGCGCSSSQLL